MRDPKWAQNELIFLCVSVIINLLFIQRKFSKMQKEFRLSSISIWTYLMFVICHLASLTYDKLCNMVIYAKCPLWNIGHLMVNTWVSKEPSGTQHPYSLLQKYQKKMVNDNFYNFFCIFGYSLQINYAVCRGGLDQNDISQKVNFISN